MNINREEKEKDALTHRVLGSDPATAELAGGRGGSRGQCRRGRGLVRVAGGVDCSSEIAERRGKRGAAATGVQYCRRCCGYAVLPLLLVACAQQRGRALVATC